jgi:hypothetical protein
MDDPITAAAKVIYAAGRHYHWWGFEKPYDEMDSIARSEFEGVVEQALLAADVARRAQEQG